MRLHIKATMLSLILILGSICTINAVNVSLPVLNNLTNGQTIEIPITVTDLSGLGIISYFADIRFSEAVLTCTGVIKTGTLSSSWGTPTVNTNIDGRVTIAVYGTQPLSGQGTLLKVVFTVTGTTGFGTPLNFNVFQFNEGTPIASTQNGYVSLGVPNPPAIPILNLPLDGVVNLPIQNTLRWSQSINARYYQLQLASSSTFTSGIIVDQNTISDTTYQVSNLQRSTIYYWRVRSINPASTSIWSSVRNFTTILNQLPVSNLPATLVLLEDQSYNQNIQNLFSDADSDPISVTVYSSAHINASLNQWSLQLVPTLNWNGSEGIRFSIYDGFDTVLDTVLVTVTPVNDAPVINLPASFTFAEDGNIVVDMATYVGDVDNTNLTVMAQNSAHITVVMNGMNATLTSSLNWNGTEAISFTVSDGLLSTSGQVNVIVTPVNDSPVIDLPASFTFAEDSTLPINMATYASDVDNTTLILTASGNTNVTIAITGMNVTLGALLNWSGTEQVTFTVNDNMGRAIASDVTDIIVTPVNDAPVINLPVSFTFAEDSNLVVNLATYISDVDNTNLTVSAQNSAHITVVMNGLIATLTSSPNWNGTEPVSFTVSDGLLNTTDQVNVIVTPVNDAPVIDLPASFTFAEDGTLPINMATYASDVDNTTLILTASGNTNVTVAITGMNVILGALLNWNGTEQVTFTVNDNMGRAIASDVTDIIVTPVNDPPTIVSFSPLQTTISAELNETLSFSIIASDVDSPINYSWFVNNVNQNNTSNALTYQFTQYTTYEVKAVVSDNVLTVEQIWTISVPVANDDEFDTPLVTRLYANYPNPFNPRTTIRYSTKEPCDVYICVYNIKGNLVKNLIQSRISTGSYTIDWDGTNNAGTQVSSGIYYLYMKTNHYQSCKKMIMLK
jgi:hypothetical protein